MAVDAKLVDQVNRAMPVNKKAKVGTRLQDVITAHNALQASFNVLVAKLNADAGVTDTNYAASPATATVADLGA